MDGPVSLSGAGGYGGGMCGLVGIVAWERVLRADQGVMETLCARIAHRGPDGQGIWISPDPANATVSSQSPPRANADLPPAYVSLGHRRLAVLDVDARSNQPFISADGQVALVFNGEIYNYRQLRDQLSHEMPDYPWRTTGDTEVILAAYLHWGERCIELFNGMFAIVIWDARTQSLFLARDRVGKKPLFVATAGGMELEASDSRSNQPPRAVAFASELGAMRAVPWLSREHLEVRASSLQDYLLFGYVPGWRTIYQGIARLRPGHWMRINSGGYEVRRYFDAGGSLAADLPAELIGLPVQDQARRLIEQSVEDRLVSDVPLGCFLSGGIDSSVVAAAMVRRASGRVKTFSIGFDEAGFDESPFAREVATHLGTDHHEFHVHMDAAADLPRLAAVFGEPFADSSALPTHCLSMHTRQQVTVALSGDGGDELFGGYDRYRAMRRLRAMDAIPGGRLIAALSQALPGNNPRHTLTRIKRAMATLGLPAGERYAQIMRLFDLQQVSRLLGRVGGLRTDPQIVGDRWFSEFAGNWPVGLAAMAMDRATYLPDDLLTKVDRASMLHALEVRCPLLDHRLIRFAANLTPAQVFSDGKKPLLRAAFGRDLPSSVFDRPKQGFAVPIGDWFRSSLRDMLHDHLLASDAICQTRLDGQIVQKMIDDHQSRHADHSQRLYALLMLELWHLNSRKEIEVRK